MIATVITEFHPAVQGIAILCFTWFLVTLIKERG